MMKKASNTDSYLHILKYISLFGGVQVLNVLIGTSVTSALQCYLDRRESVLSLSLTRQQDS